MFRESLLFNHLYSVYENWKQNEDFEYNGKDPLMHFHQLYLDMLMRSDEHSDGFFQEMAIIIYKLRDMYPCANTFPLAMHIREELILDIRCAITYMPHVCNRFEVSVELSLS